MMRRLAPLVVIMAMPGCGLHPVYSGGTTGQVATALSQIEVAPIAGRSGWLVVNALRDRLPPVSGTARYRVVIKLDDDLAALGIRRDDTVTRERRTLRARYQLIEAGSGAVLVDATAGSDIGVDVVGSDYATIAAEDTALERLVGIVADQVVARLARYVRAEGQVTRATP